MEDKTDWYNKAKEFWSKSEATITGVLGGEDQVHAIDIKTSSELLEGLIKTGKLIANRVIDCGAGIGRVTSNLLLNYFKECDIMEQDQKYVEFCKDAFKNENKVKNIYQSSFQNFKFDEDRKYNVIWIQWCLENLDDDDLLEFMVKCRNALESDGLVIVKENIVMKGYHFSESDFSKQRSDLIFKEIFNKSGLKITKHFHHPNWPEDLMKVSVFVLKGI